MTGIWPSACVSEVCGFDDGTLGLIVSPGRQSPSYKPLRMLWAAGGMAVAIAGSAHLAHAQQDLAGEPQPVTGQTVATSNSMTLNAALSRLGRNPRDITALIDAGNAALAIGDVDASIGFFSRANQVTPGNPRIKAGLARALVRSGNPFDAIPLFDEAERGGAMDSTVALDRGLAYDLVADNTRAQSYYRLALSAGPNDEANRRLAISLAIAGDKRGSAAVLTPLLVRQDKAAWRARAFALAILGQSEDAVAVVNTTLPKQLASGIAPYLRYMPRLTRSQQAAASNFGQFPRAAEIGQDDPRVTRYATTAPRRPAVAAADAGLVPKGEPLGRSAPPRDAARTPIEARVAAAPVTHVPETRNRRDPRIAPPEPQPGRETAPAALTSAPGLASPLATAPAQVPQAVPVRASAVPVAIAPTPASPPVVIAGAVVLPAAPSLSPAPAAAATVSAGAPLQTPAGLLAARTFSLPPGPSPTVALPPAATPVPIARSVQAPPALVPARRPSLSEAFSDLAWPAIDVAPARGAVDIRRIKPAREVAANAVPAKQALPHHPSRIWVQLATGRDKAALSFDWRRMARQGEAALKGKRSFVSAWGQTNRLLTGPFESEAAANAFIAQLRRADLDGAFIWTSPAGQPVDAATAR